MVTTGSRVDEIWTRYSMVGDMDLRNELVMYYIHLVKRIVNRLFPKYRNHNEYDDLMSCGVLGLIDAVEKFDISKNVKFETYASLRIRGEIIDHMRKQDPIPVNIRAKLKKIETAIEELEIKLGRAASDQEIADYIGISVSDLENTLEDSHCFNVLYLDELIEDSSFSSNSLKAHDSIEDEIDREEMKAALANEISKLPEKERLVINLYYFDEMTFKEIALILGLTESRISQIHSKVLLKLRDKARKLL